MGNKKKIEFVICHAVIDNGIGYNCILGILFLLDFKERCFLNYPYNYLIHSISYLCKYEQNWKRYKSIGCQQVQKRVN